jgi:outer membrane immunogenic protein
MKKQLLASVAVVGLAAATPAGAAPPASQVYNWTGFYAGGNIGYSWGNADTSLNAPGLAGIDLLGSLPLAYTSTLKPNGLIGGAQAGYNWQVSSKWVLGVETDFQGSAEKANTRFSNVYTCDFEGATCNLSQTRDAKIHWFGTVRGRVGWLIDPAILLYGTAGLAYGKVSVSGLVTDDINNTGASFLFSQSKVKVGVALGAGVEGAIANSRNWTWKVEYLYIDLGSISGIGFEPISGNSYGWNAKFTDNILRAGFNYRLP